MVIPLPMLALPHCQELPQLQTMSSVGKGPSALFSLKLICSVLNFLLIQNTLPS